MAIVGSVVVKYGSDTAEFHHGTAKVMSDAKKTNDAIVDGAAQAGKKAKSAYSQMLSDLNENFGKRSTFGKTMKLFAGAGVIGALGSAAHQVDELAKKTEELYLAARKGEMGWQDVTSELLRSIPVAGQLGDAVDRLYGILSGRTGEVADIQAATAKVEAHTKMMAEAAKELDRLNERNRTAGLHGRELERDNITTQLAGELKAAQEKYRGSAKLPAIQQASLTYASGQLAKSLAEEGLGQATKIVETTSKQIADAIDRTHYSLTTTGATPFAPKNIAEMVGKQVEIISRALNFRGPDRDPLKPFNDGLQTMKGWWDRISGAIDNAADRAKDWLSEAGGLVKEAMTPLEQYEEKVRDINQHTGFGGLTTGQAQRLRDMALKQLQDAQRAPTLEAVTRRSAFSVPAEDKIVDPIQETAKNTEDSKITLGNILTAIQSNPLGAAALAVMSIPGV